MKKFLIGTGIVLVSLYLIVCVLLYFFQEKIIFIPTKLSKNHQYQFLNNYEEIFVEVGDGVALNGLLFKVENPKGVIFYMHGNAGNLDSWGNVAPVYNELNYDVFVYDYRGYGKSDGKILNQEQIFADNQKAYDFIKNKYEENQITILGYSIGTGMASKLASENNPKQLILQAPYYNLPDIMKQNFSFIPTSILKYKLDSNEYLKKYKNPITIFHGTEDKIIYYGSSEKLKQNHSQINLIPIENFGHNGMTFNEKYLREIQKVL
ncbi:alpha/beta hydrolase [Aureivirga sp. CE67]|uniref:alpha/beta hydrolase n=1 Tax=Aureivirga sp. CE67 TaxID=1788983 RepID=UPI0018C91D78|nr:alpha/beta fold hydrolase [Aureivirga sp. CE67]